MCKRQFYFWLKSSYSKLFPALLCIWLIGLVGRVFTNGPGDLGSISSQVIPKTLKMVLDTSLLNTQQYKVHIKGKLEQSRERSSTPPLHLGVVAIEKGAFWLPLTTVVNKLNISCLFTQLNVKTVLFQKIQLSIIKQIWPIEMTLSGATTLGPEWTWEWWQ